MVKSLVTGAETEILFLWRERERERITYARLITTETQTG